MPDAGERSFAARRMTQGAAVPSHVILRHNRRILNIAGFRKILRCAQNDTRGVSAAIILMPVSWKICDPVLTPFVIVKLLYFYEDHISHAIVL